MRARAAASTSARVASSSVPSSARSAAPSEVTTRTYSGQSPKRYSTGTSATVDLVEARAADERLDLLSARQRELAGLPGLRRLLQPPFDQHRPVRRRPGVPLRRSPRRERERPACAQHAPGLAQGASRIRHEHVAEAGDDRIDARVRQVDLLHVHHPMLRIRRLRDAAPPRPSPAKGRSRSRARPGAATASVMSPVPAARSSTTSVGLRTKRGEKRLGDRRVDARDKLALGLPAGRGGVPAPPDVVGRLYAATPLNSGRMSRP